MSTRRNLSFTGAGIAFLAAWMSVAASKQAIADTGSTARPVPVLVVDVQPQERGLVETPPPQEPIPLPEQGPDETLITNVLARPQPEKSTASQLPQQEALGHVAGTTRPWEMSVSAWESPAFCHRPLYFEDENLERHGRSFGILQPAASTIHFAGRTLAFPYLVGAIPPHECIYTLGRERPGTCAAYRVYRPPVSVHGAATAGATAAGLSFVVP